MVFRKRAPPSDGTRENCEISMSIGKLTEDAFLFHQLRIVGEMETDEETRAENTPLLDGKVPLASLKCGKRVKY